MKPAHIHLRVPPEQKERIARAAAEREVTANQLVSEFVADRLGGPFVRTRRGRRPIKTP